MSNTYILSIRYTPTGPRAKGLPATIIVTAADEADARRLATGQQQLQPGEIISVRPLGFGDSVRFLGWV